jgi:hypothetical protein
MDDELQRISRSLERQIDDLRDHLERLREADLEAVRLRHRDLSTRMEGFPQEFARKAELTEASKALQKLERDSVAREIYDTQHKALADLVAKMEREKLDEAVFDTFVENYRISMDNAAVERRAVAAGLAASSERRAGAAATWKQIAAVVTIAVSLLGLFLAIVVLFANHTIG